MFPSIVPPEFVQRTTILAAAAGHIGVRITKPLDEAAEVVSELFSRASNVYADVSQNGNVSGSEFRTVLTPDGKAFKVATKATVSPCAQNFWTGRGLQGDRIVACSLGIEEVLLKDATGPYWDPFVSANVWKFLGRKGVELIRRINKDNCAQVVLVLVGPPSELYFFGKPNVLTDFCSRLFSCSQFSRDYLIYSKGPFAPIEVAARLVPKSRLA